jgi:polar amino acid transport system substrate-binding protein
MAACDLPRDADGTLARVKGGAVRVGVIVDPPWVVDSGSDVSGVEAALAQGIAHELGARVAWVRGPAPKLMLALRDRQLDLVIGGLTSHLPWKQEVAFTRPYYRDHEQHVLAAPPGENAWLVIVERYLRQHGSEAVQRVASAHP